MQQQGIEIFVLLRRISMELGRRMKDVYEPLGLTGPQALILIELFRRDQQKICDLSHSAGMTVSNISAICQRLEHNGFIHRVRSSEDQRVVTVCLSEMTKQKIRDCDVSLSAEGCTLFENVSEAQLRMILEGLEALDALLSKETL